MAGKLLEPLDLTPHLDKAKNRIYKVGIELEGGWNTVPKGVALTRDTSVHVNADYVGELPSPPLSVEEVPAWLKKYYPHKVDKSCGMHVHISLVSASNYQRLMDPVIMPTTLKYFTDWAIKNNLPPSHAIWGRIKGDCEYCQHLFNAEHQVHETQKRYDRTVKGHRYTLWNFAYLRTGTAECRLLPMMANHELAASAVQELVKITNAFLLAQAKLDRKVQSKLVDDGPYEREEIIEVM